MSAGALRYRYRAASRTGAMVTGRIEASGESEAMAMLARQGLHPLSCTRDRGTRGRSAARRRDLAILFRSLAALTRAGLPVERALRASEPLVAGVLRRTVAEARRLLQEGRSLSQALAAGDGVVPPLVIGMLQAGERASRVPETLEGVALQLEQEADLVARVRQALTYPALVAAAGTVSILVIGTVIVPRFAELLGDMGQQLPPTTRLLLGGSVLLTHYGWAIALGGALALGGIVEGMRRDAIRRRVHEMLLRLPLVGPVRRALATARVGRALGGMLGSGMPLLAALDAVRDAAGDEAIAARLERAREDVAQGRALATSLERAGAFLPAALQILAVGEASGQLGAMTLRAGDYAASEADRSLKTLTTLLEPGLIVLFGGLVAFVAAALLQAVYSLRPGAA